MVWEWKHVERQESHQDWSWLHHPGLEPLHFLCSCSYYHGSTSQWKMDSCKLIFHISKSSKIKVVGRGKWDTVSMEFKLRYLSTRGKQLHEPSFFWTVQNFRSSIFWSAANGNSWKHCLISIHSVVVYYLPSTPAGWPKRTGSGQSRWKRPWRMRTFFQPQLSKATGAGELSGSDPWAWSFWLELTRAFRLRTNWSDRPDQTNGKRP